MEKWKEKRISKLAEFGEKTFFYDEERNFPFIDVDDEFCHMFGYEKEELYIQCRGLMKEMIYPADVPETEKYVISQIEEKGEYTCRYRMRHKNGELLWVWESGELLEDEQGRNIIRAIVVDISGMERIRKERDITYDNIPGGVVRLLITDSTFYIVEANKQYCEMMNVPGKEYFGSSGINTFMEDLPAVGGHIVRQAKKHLPIDYSFRGHQHGDEEVRWYRLVGHHYGEAEEGCEYLCILLDITESQKTLYQLKRQQKRYQLAIGTTSRILFEYNITADEFQIYGDFSAGRYIPIIEENAFGSVDKLLRKSGLIHPDDFSVMERLIENDRTMTDRARVCVKNRSTGEISYQWYEVEVSPIFKRRGESWVVGSARTLEEKEEDEANRLELQNILKMQSTKTYETIVIVDAKTGVLKGYYSDQFSFQVIYPKDTFQEYVDKMLEKHVYPEDKERFSRSLRLEHMKEILKFNEEEEVLFFRIRKAEAEYHRYKCFRYSYLSDEMKYIVITVQDVHQLREEQMKLEEANRKIMASALEVKQSTMEIRRNFSTMIARELREPLQYVEQALRRQSLEGEEADKLKLSLSYMRGVLDTISEQEKFERGKVRFDNKQFDVSDMLNELLEIWEQKVKDSNCQLDYSMNIKWSHYIGDPGRIAEIINNVIGNSIRASIGEEGHVNVWINDEEINEGSGKLYVVVEDNGVPVNENYYGRLYPLEEGMNSAWSMGELYLGNSMSLILARQIVEQMGGTITLTRKRERTNLIEVEIPLLRSQEAKQPILEKDKKKKDKVDLSSYALLLVEKTSEKEELTGPILKLHGAQVDVAGSGKEAIKLWQSYPEGTFQGVVVVGNLEDMDYLTFTEKFRKLKRESATKIPIIICTNRARLSAGPDDIRAGINAILNRPLDVKRLKKVLDALLFGIV